MRFFTLNFFQEFSSPGPLIITEESFQIFLEFAEIFVASITETSDEFTADVNATSLPRLTPAVNLPLVSTTPVVRVVKDAAGKFSASLSDTGGKQRQQYQIVYTLSVMGNEHYV
jgi:deoxyribodipyrimidine photolyase-like uncharacterized protein